MTHIDDWLDDPTTGPADVKEWLEHFRRPAIDKDHAWLRARKLFCTYNGKRYRSLGDQDITNPVVSNASNIGEILIELNGTKVPERAGRALDHETEDAFERLRVAGYL